MSDRDLKLDRPSPYCRATDRMIDFAAAIATVLELNPPSYEDFLETQAFINEHVDEFYALPKEDRWIDDWHVYNVKHGSRANISMAKLANLASQYIIPYMERKEPPFDNGIDLSDEEYKYISRIIIEDRFEYTNRIDSVPFTREEFVNKLSDYYKSAVPRLAIKHYSADK